jgi:hypothetical protein
MLGNIRFHPTLVPGSDPSTGQQFLSLVLTPRSVDGMVDLASNGDFSCLLREVQVDGQAPGSVPFVVQEQYWDTRAAGGKGAVVTATQTFTIPKVSS